MTAINKTKDAKGDSIYSVTLTENEMHLIVSMMQRDSVTLHGYISTKNLQHSDACIHLFDEFLNSYCSEIEQTNI